MARHTPGNYVPLDVNYPRDAAIRRAGPDAELLFVRGLAYAKGARSRGIVPDYDLDVAAIGLRNVQRSVTALVRERLWVEVDGGWFIRSWESWNDTDDDRSEQQSAGGRRGNHERWHIGRSVTDPDCPLCTDSAPDSPTDIGTRSVSDSPTDVAPDSGTESQGKGREGKGRTTTREAAASARCTFDQFWTAYPRKTAKRNAEKAWAAALKRADPTTIMAGLTRFRFNPDPQFVPHPATWLNGDRWADDQAGPAGTPGSFTADELNAILGPPPPLPQPPQMADDKAMWEWEQNARREQRADRVRQANAKLGRPA